MEAKSQVGFGLVRPLYAIEKCRTSVRSVHLFKDHADRRYIRWSRVIYRHRSSVIIVTMIRSRAGKRYRRYVAITCNDLLPACRCAMLIHLNLIHQRYMRRSTSSFIHQCHDQKINRTTRSTSIIHFIIFFNSNPGLNEDYWHTTIIQQWCR